MPQRIPVSDQLVVVDSLFPVQSGAVLDRDHVWTLYPPRDDPSPIFVRGIRR